MEIENPPQELSANISVEPQIRYACVLLKHLGNSASNIVQILKEFDDVEISERSVYRFSKQWKEEHRIKSQFHRKGNQIYSEDDKQMIVEEFQKDPTLSTYQAHISNQVNPKGMSKETIRLTLHNSGLKSFIIPKIINIKQNKKEQRLKFCKAKSRWIQRWHDVFFSDECSVFAQLSGKKFAWVENKDQITNEMCQEKVQYPLKLMVWAIISYQQGPASIKWVEGSINSESYIQILDNFMQEHQNIINERSLFQQDNAKAHSSAKTLEWINNQNIELLEWPAQSPDLSPIENIWPILKEDVWNLRERIETKEDLFAVIENCFFNSEDIKKTIRNGYNSLPDRIKKIIQLEGDYLRY